MRYSEVYKLFVEDENVDLSEEAQQESYMWESQGIGNFKFGVMELDKTRQNGYILGKHWMGVTVSIWKAMIKEGVLFEHELYALKRYPIWWLDEVLK